MMTRYLLVVVFLLLPGASLAGDGAELYRKHCSACHGDQGEGGVGVPLALPDFQRQVSNHFLAQTIRYGRPGRVMPGFDNLSEAQVQALVEHVRSFVDVEPPVYEQTRVQGNAQRGKQLYGANCARCHGIEAKGGQGTGVTFSRPRDLPIIAPALNNAGFLKSASDAMIKHTLQEGRENTPMPSFLKQGLSEAQINDVVAYIRQFEHALPTQAARPAPGHEELTLVYSSPYDLQTTLANIQRAAQGKNFRIIRVQPLNQGLVEEGKEDRKQVIVYFCNFKMLNSALAIDPRVGLFLPCRVTLVEQAGEVKVYAINPERLSHLFNNQELDLMCVDMHETYVSILEEATF